MGVDQRPRNPQHGRRAPGPRPDHPKRQLRLAIPYPGKRAALRNLPESAWLKERFQKLAAFPDVMVRCGPIEPDAPSVDDPMILIEVISPTSGSRDRGEKTPAYMRLGSARHICLIDRDRVRIDVFDRNEMGWAPRAPIETLDEAFELAAIEFSMPVAEIYRDVLPQAGLTG